MKSGVVTVMTGGLVAALLLAAAGRAEEGYVALSYHDVRDDVYHDLDPDRSALNTESLIAEFEWLGQHGFLPISVDDVLAARREERPLPENAVLLTFDDGLASVYSRVFPLLKLFGYPAVVSIVTGWIDREPGFELEYGGRRLGPEGFVHWSQLAEMAASGLVEIACHSHDLHGHVPSNPQGNVHAGAVTRRYDADSGTYESESAYRRRIRDDLAGCAARIREEIGVRPRVVAWPYGESNPVIEEIARELGMPISLGFRGGRNRVSELTGIRRQVVTENPELGSFVWGVRHPEPGPSLLRVSWIDPGDLLDDTAGEEKLDALLARVRSLRPTTVVVRGFAANDAGVATELYFPNRHLPVRADVLNRVAWALSVKGGVRVWVALPLASYPWLPRGELPRGESRRRLAEVYEDLGRYVPLAGVLFDDGDPLAGDGWLELTDELGERVRRSRPQAEILRTLTPRPAGRTLAGLAEPLGSWLAHYDRVVLRAAPRLAGRRSSKRPLRELMAIAAESGKDLDRVIFELPAVDAAGRPVAAERLVRQARWLQRHGARCFGYRPDDFLGDRPEGRVLRGVLSAASYPYPKP